MSDGASHTRKRKLLTPAFHFEVLRDYTKIFHRCAGVLLVCLSDANSIIR